MNIQIDEIILPDESVLFMLGERILGQMTRHKGHWYGRLNELTSLVGPNKHREAIARMFELRAELILRENGISPLTGSGQ